MTTLKTSFLIVSVLAAYANAQNAFRLANIFQNNMVLQMEPKSAALWGFGEVGARIEINYESSQIVSEVNADGIWRVTLLPHAVTSSAPVNFEIIHNGVDVINLSAWFGDVWVCSGQNNMEMWTNHVFNSTEENNNALKYQNIRLLQVKNNFILRNELLEVTNFVHAWEAPDTFNVPGFSALCLFFGERLSQSHNNQRPIGLIDSTLTGTRIEAWFSQRVSTYCLTPPYNGTGDDIESGVWNAMIAPLTSTAVRGAIWYQGESNVYWNPDFYSCHMVAMIQDWKNTFVSGDVPAENGIAFPFGIVQIGPAEQVENYDWGKLRFHQTGDQGILPNPYMPEAFFATAYDLTDRSAPTEEMHTRDKQTVADRLANAAKNLLYGENFSTNGPIPTRISEDFPDQITITYDRNIRMGGPVGFDYQKADGVWTPAQVIYSTANSVTVGIDATTTLLTLGYRSTVCEYKTCPVYSDDAEDLPAQVWQWDIAALRKVN